MTAFFLYSVPSNNNAGLSAELNSEGAMKYMQEVGVNIIYYSVNGSNANVVRDNINKLGPDDHNGNKVDAYTAWSIDWQWPTKQNGEPDFLSTAVKYKINVTLPKWLDKNLADPHTRQDWQAYYDNLVLHEFKHVKHVTENYNNISESIKKAALENPSLSSAQANQIAKNVLAKIRNLDLEYDRNTKHGRLEGVHFP